MQSNEKAHSLRSPLHGSVRHVALAAFLLAGPAACGGGSPSTGPPSAGATPAATREATTPPATPGPTVARPDLAAKIDIGGGHALYIECFGLSGPVLVLDAGSGSAGSTWRRGQPDFVALLDNDYRRCFYDRTNVGRSDSDDAPRTSATSASELHALLAAAGLPPPYVLVARSFGGYSSRLFTAAYPSEVTALVLVETLTPEFHSGMELLLSPAQWADEVAGVQSYEAPLDVLRSGVLVREAGLPDVPLLVIAGTKHHAGNRPWPAAWPGEALDALWARSQEALAASVPGARLIVFEGGDHSLQVSQPERLATEINGFLDGLP